MLVGRVLQTIDKNVLIAEDDHFLDQALVAPDIGRSVQDAAVKGEDLHLIRTRVRGLVHLHTPEKEDALVDVTDRLAATADPPVFQREEKPGLDAQPSVDEGLHLRIVQDNRLKRANGRKVVVQATQRQIRPKHG